MLRLLVLFGPLLLLLACPAPAAASEHTITWKAPTTCEDGLPIGTPPSDTHEGCGPLIDYRLQCGVVAGGPYNTHEWLVPAPALTDTREYPPGPYFCRLSVNNSAGWSKWSEGEASFVSTVEATPAAKPDRPTDLTVSAVERTAYAIDEFENGIVLHPVGVVTAGAECNTAIEVNGKFVVPRESVIWYGDTQPAVVVADCDAPT